MLKLRVSHQRGHSSPLHYAECVFESVAEGSRRQVHNYPILGQEIVELPVQFPSQIQVQGCESEHDMSMFVSGFRYAFKGAYFSHVERDRAEQNPLPISHLGHLLEDCGILLWVSTAPNDEWYIYSLQHIFYGLCRLRWRCVLNQRVCAHQMNCDHVSPEFLNSKFGPLSGVVSDFLNMHLYRLWKRHFLRVEYVQRNCG